MHFDSLNVIMNSSASAVIFFPFFQIDVKFFLFNTILFRCKLHIFSSYRYIFHTSKNWENSPKVDSEKREEGQEDKLSGLVDSTEVLFMHHVEYI